MSVTQLASHNLVLAAVANATAAAAGTGVDISPAIADWELILTVSKLTAAKTARIVIYDSADNFVSDALPGPSWSFVGEIQAGASVTVSLKKEQFPNFRAGVTGAKARVDLAAIDSGGSISYTVSLRATELDTLS